MKPLSLLSRLIPTRDQRQQRAEILDAYVHTAPSPQNAADIFKGEWSSRLPLDGVETGGAELFDDARVCWGVEQVGGVEGKTVLDLGPLEGGHSAMFERMGAAEVVAVEANTRAYLKCLVTKELLGLKRVTFLCGDFIEYLRAEPRRFDVVNASGVLYHMSEPAELIARACRAADAVNVWTHYYDAAALAGDPRLDALGERAAYEDFAYTKHRQSYGRGLWGKGFCGAGSTHSYWMPREEILRAFGHFGMTDVRTAFVEPAHVNGPCFSLTARRV